MKCNLSGVLFLNAPFLVYFKVFIGFFFMVKYLHKMDMKKMIKKV